MLLIKDIMTSPVYTVEAGASAGEAAWALTRRHIGGAPARDAAGNLVGVLSSSDLVNPEPAQWIKAAVNDMAKRSIHRIVVLDGDSNLAGIVTPMDVVRALARGDRFDLSE